MTKFALLLSFLAPVSLWAQSPAPAPAAPQAPAAQVTPAEPPAIPDDGVRVAVLGYHDITELQPETAMRMHTSKFRQQMEAIRQLGLSVITLEDFIAWKKGDKQIPAKSILLTFDDGWKTVYTDAFPILKEYHFPFTLYLYKEYVDGGGKALTTPMIDEMVAYGASIGSHSVTHPYPATIKMYRKKGPNEYDAFLRKEMGESKRFLETKFPTRKVTTFAYPGGFYTEEMETLADEFGYTQLFTVIPGKVKRGLPDKTVPRYMILGNYDKVFEFATTFREAGATVETAVPGTTALVQTTPFPVTPEPGAIINTRLPEVSADLSTLTDYDPATLVMKIAGFGDVPAVLDPTTKKLTWKVNRRLRQPLCEVSVVWKDKAGKPPQTPLHWTFQIDREAAYLPEGE